MISFLRRALLGALGWALPGPSGAAAPSGNGAGGGAAGPEVGQRLDAARRRLKRAIPPPED